MSFHKNRNKNRNRRELTGILICIIVGIVVLALELRFSKVDLPVIDGGELTEYGQNWTVAVRNVMHKDITLPMYIEEAKIGDILILQKQLPEKIENDTYLFFRASHQKVKAYIDEKEIYSFGWKEKRLYGKTPACAWVLVPILKEQAGKKIQIELTGVYKQYAGRTNHFYIGDKSAILTYLVTNRIGSIFICVALIIMGFSMMITAFVLRRGKTIQSLLRLGVLAILVGIWSACTVNALQVLFGDVFVLLNLEFLTFYLLLPTTIWFMSSFDYYKDKILLQILFWCSIFLAVVTHLLQLFSVADYMETIIAYHVLMGISILYLTFDSAKEFLKRNTLREIKILTISVAIVVAFSGIDLFKFYLYTTIDDGFFTRIGMLLFIVMWASEIIKNMSKLIVMMTQTQ